MIKLRYPYFYMTYVQKVVFELELYRWDKNRGWLKYSETCL